MLIAIDLSSNKLCGEIPDVMGDLTGLGLLNLSNMSSGTIPSSWGNLSNLQALNLSHNNLLGLFPQQLEELTFLSYFNVSFNNLSGPIPQNKKFSTIYGNQGLYGNQLLKKCEMQGHHLVHLQPLMMVKTRVFSLNLTGKWFWLGMGVNLLREWRWEGLSVMSWVIDTEFTCVDYVFLCLLSFPFLFCLARVFYDLFFSDGVQYWNKRIWILSCGRI